MEYRVKWEIDIEAKSPRKAAEGALRIQRKISDATFFEVIDKNGKVTLVDLEVAEEEV